MKILFFKSKWEAPHLSLEQFLDRVVSDSFEGAEIYLPGENIDVQLLRGLLVSRNLELIAQIATEGNSPLEHLDSLDKWVALALEAQPRLINVQGGRDIFNFEDNYKIYSRSVELSEKYGVPVCMETHRSRPTFSGPGTRRLLDAVPGLRLTGDFSHWMCVHETDLIDQWDNVEAALKSTEHIHARVGFPEGPQVPDPLAPEYKDLLEIYLKMWRSFIVLRSAKGWKEVSITPEFGPIPYMPALPYTCQPLADTWEINSTFRQFLAEELI